MSTAYSSAKQQYIGNGVTTEWGFDFPIQKHSELKVYLKRSGQLQVLLEEGVDYSFVTENTIAFPIKTGEAKLQATDVLALQRESVFESEYNFSNQQRLEPEEVMHADDNLERQIQELKRDVTQAIRIQPTSNINTDEYFIAVESIYENLDDINNVSGISAEIVNCSDNISDISTVSTNIANVNAVGQSISSVNTVANNISSVNVAAANIEFIKSAENNANDAKNSKIEAQNSAVTAQLMAAQAQDWATKTDGKVDGANYSSKYYAGQASNSANNSHIWAEGTDAQVQALGGVHSSKVWAEQSTNANVSLSNLSAAGQAKFDAKANVANTVTTDADQTISSCKSFTNQQGMSIQLVANTDQQTVPSVDSSRYIGLYRNATYTKGDGYTSWVCGIRKSDGWTATELYARRFLEGDSKEIINYIRVRITPNGSPISYTKTPPANVVGEEIVTAGWFRQSGCTARTVIETYRNGGNWYRVWSDGWIEQGSMAVSINAIAGAAFVINYFKPFSVSDNQMITMTPFEQDANDTGTNFTVIRREANKFTGVNVGYARNPLVISWYACGY